MNTNPQDTNTPMPRDAAQCPDGTIDSTALARANGLDARVLVSELTVVEYAAWRGNREHMIDAALVALARAGAGVTVARIQAPDEMSRCRRTLVMQIERTADHVPTITITLPSELGRPHAVR